MRSTPNQKTQDYESILIFFGLTFFLTYAVQVYFTWNWFSGWGSFDDHSKFFISLIKSLLKLGSGSDWNYYWGWIEKNGLYLHFYLHILIPFLISLFSSYKLTKKICWEDGGNDISHHVEGKRLYAASKAIKFAKKCAKKSIKNEGRKSRGIKIHPEFHITKKIEQSNIGVLGTTGSGKTAVILPIIYQVILSGERAFIFDKKREFTPYFLDKRAILIAPWDKRSRVWDIARDIRNHDDAKTVADNLIPILNSHDQMWIKGARLIFAGMLISLLNEGGHWGWNEIAQRLKVPQNEMQSLLEQHYPIASSFVVENSKTTQGFYVNLISELAWIETLAQAWAGSDQSKFSIRDWIASKDKKCPQTIIVQSDERFDSIGAPVCNALISLMTTYFLVQTQEGALPTWLFIDEMANLPANPDLIQWLELSRSRGGRTVLGTQSISQIKSIYGDHDADTILNLLSTLVSLRIGSAGRESEYVSNAFGTKVVDRPSTHIGDRTWSRCEELVVEERDLTQLDMPSKTGVTGFLLVPSWNYIFRLTWPYFKRKKVVKEQVLADWVTSRPKTKTVSSGNRLFGERS
ncbi:type IV secretion system DNA-binding domain-containing protein [Marinomonas spartinae]|uniref:type IV secretion system DNA-binding domain-containing protein n=1 Tax=Marinomonas spartinae TaxID=1792290 RepID=UPI0018F1BA58|nr:type IV secretion system DNA-binding domain-containing protein [Marinomonas spartinae]MBJ7557020.1 type IV secretion system DNA-binding domain-containing protein [Marinomonas spartinae]